jgi:hypothetical protein
MTVSHMSIATQAADWTRLSQIGQLMARMHIDASRPPSTFVGLPNPAQEVQRALADVAHVGAVIRRAADITDLLARMNPVAARLGPSTTLTFAAASDVTNVFSRINPIAAQMGPSTTLSIAMAARPGLSAITKLRIPSPARVTRRGV